MTSALDEYLENCGMLFAAARDRLQQTHERAGALSHHEADSTEQELEAIRREASRLRQDVEVALRASGTSLTLADPNLRAGGPPVLSLDEVRRCLIDLQDAGLAVIALSSTPNRVFDVESAPTRPSWGPAALVGIAVVVVALLLILLLQGKG